MNEKKKKAKTKLKEQHDIHENTIWMEKPDERTIKESEKKQMNENKQTKGKK